MNVKFRREWYQLELGFAWFAVLWYLILITAIVLLWNEKRPTIGRLPMTWNAPSPYMLSSTGLIIHLSLHSSLNIHHEAPTTGRLLSNAFKSALIAAALIPGLTGIPVLPPCLSCFMRFWTSLKLRFGTHILLPRIRTPLRRARLPAWCAAASGMGTR